MTELTRDASHAVACLRQARHVLVMFHASPDGDALGSALGFAEHAAALGVSATIVSRDPAPASLAFLPGIEKVLLRTDLTPAFLADFDLAVILECPDLDRTGFDPLTNLPILNIDHHLANTAHGEVNYVDDEAPAVGEMVLRIADAGGVPVTPTMATCLYTALVTDTGDFRHSNSTPRAFAAAQRLVECGARPHEIAEALWSQTPARVVRLVGAVLATLELEADNRIALVTCDLEMLGRTGAGREDTEGLINYPRSIAGVEVAVLLKSFNTGETRASLRSRGTVDVQEIAASFGGGGHRAASGCTIKAPLAEARRLLLARLLASLETA